MDRGIARATLAIYKPAVPTTLEGFVYAGLGILLVLAVYQLGIRGPISRRIKRRAAARATAIA
jgi:type II secretory pathway component PulM